MLKILLVSAAGLAAATVALAQSEPGAGAPAAANGEPYAPNASIAPTAVPNGGAMGTQANDATNQTRLNADQSDQSQSAQPHGPTWRRTHPRPNATSVGGVSDRAPSSRPLPPTNPPPQ